MEVVRVGRKTALKLASHGYLLLLHCSNVLLLVDFSAMTGFPGSDAQPWLVTGCEGDLFDVRVWLETICVGWMEAGEMAASRFSTAPAGGINLLFSCEGGLVDGGSWLGGVRGTPRSATLGWGVIGGVLRRGAHPLLLSPPSSSFSRLSSLLQQCLDEHPTLSSFRWW